MSVKFQSQEDMKKQIKRQGRLAAFVFIGILLIVLGILGGVGYITLHFINKFW